MNLLAPALVRDLVTLIQQSEADESIQVLVFTSSDPDYLISHFDVTRIAEYREQAVRLVGEPSLGMLFRRLSESRVVTIAQIEGRTRGAGSEFVLACDKCCSAPIGRFRRGLFDKRGNRTRVGHVDRVAAWHLDNR